MTQFNVLSPQEIEQAAREGNAIVPAYGSGAAEHRHAEQKAIAQVALKDTLRQVVEMLDRDLYFTICGIVNGDLRSCRKEWCEKCSFRLPRLDEAIQTIKQAIEVGKWV